MIPAVGGSSDVGFGGGALFSLTRFSPGSAPYLWHVEGAAFATAGGLRSDVTFPYQEYYLELTIPAFLDRRLRLIVRPSYNREGNLQYWGLGNASVYAPRWQSIHPLTNPEAFLTAVKYNEYIFLRPGLRADLRIELPPPFYIMVGGMLTQNVADIDPHSKIADDRRGASGPIVRGIVSGPDTYGVLQIESALLYDTRDDEVAPERGVFHKFAVRSAPGGSGDLPYNYAGFNVTTRFYVCLVEKRLSLAFRLLGDALAGHVPINELARFDTMAYGMGGVDAVRGVPADRYYGRLKVIGNVELRGIVHSFRAFKEHVRVGAAAFFDVGRLWADFRYLPALDGTGLGLHYGLGGGPRVQIGEAFLLRLDAAWSPEAHPIGAYLKAGHIF